MLVDWRSTALPEESLPEERAPGHGGNVFFIINLIVVMQNSSQGSRATRTVFWMGKTCAARGLGEGATY